MTNNTPRHMWKTVIVTVLFMLGSCDGTCLSPGSLTIINVKENTPLGEIINDLADITDTITIDSGNEYGLFDIINGSLIANRTFALDGKENEELCTWSKGNTLVLKIRCNGAAIDRTILILYTDDYPPVFNESHYTVYLDEETPVNKLNATVLQADDDDCLTQNLLYNLEDTPGSSGFNIAQDDRLSAVTELDFETKSSYLLNVMALSNDGSSAYKTGYTQMEIIVRDIDDKPPVFDVTEYMVEFPEGELPPSYMNKTTPPIAARDGDVGLNVTLNYTVMSTYPELQLSIDVSSGEVAVHEQLDRETTAFYTVIVKATQSDNEDMTATATLTVKVKDINDNRPVFSPNSTELTVPEDATSGLYLTLVCATDDDEGKNAELYYVLADNLNGAFGLERDVDGNTWLIVNETSSLRGHDVLMVQVEAREKEAPAPDSPACDDSVNCTLHVSVTVKDANLNAPVFIQPRYEFGAMNNGTLDLGQVNATDSDKGRNAEVTYNLTSVNNDPDCSKVKVDPTTGKVTASGTMTPGHVCVYLARGCDNPEDIATRRCSSVPLVVRVAETTPGQIATVITYDVNIRESQPKETVVISLPVIGLQSDTHEFMVRNRSLETTGELDRETKDFYNVTLYVGALRTTPAYIVSVTVDDVNDNAPMFVSHDRSLSLENQNVGDVILQLNATDADTDQNAELQYDLLSGGDWFQIDESTGAVSLTALPPEEFSDVPLALTARVRDSGVPSLQDVSTIQVTLTVDNATSQIRLPVPPQQLLDDKPGLTSKMSDLLSVSVSVESIVNLGKVPELGSIVNIKATDADGNVLSTPELDALLMTKAQDIYDAFKSSSPPHNGNNNNDDDDFFTTAVIAFICTAAVLLLLCLVLAFALHRSRQRNRQHSRVISKLTKDTSIYDNTLSHGPNKHSNSNGSSNNNNYNSDYNSFSNSANNGSVASASNGGPNGLNSFVNMAYVRDEDETQTQTPQAVLASPDDVEVKDAHGNSDNPYSEIASGDQERVTHFGADIAGENASSIPSPVFKSIINVGNAAATANDTAQKEAPEVVYVAEMPRESSGASDEEDGVYDSPKKGRNNSVRSSEADSGHHDEDNNDNAKNNQEETPVSLYANVISELNKGVDENAIYSVPARRASSREDEPKDVDIMGPKQHNPPPSPPPLPSSLISSSPLDSLSPVSSTSFSPEQSDNSAVETDNLPPVEPEPDYAKKVRFSDGLATPDEIKTNDTPKATDVDTDVTAVDTDVTAVDTDVTAVDTDVTAVDTDVTAVAPEDRETREDSATNQNFFNNREDEITAF
ncbi:protocadherin-17 [Aplysia californica]|uniref:Protocadherin-17 n=1 Tax=Aplysia californica TaxID=6500 RepID=A0ABM1VUT5_APLCA|nr:protocadherin-17 [Aplysia californica]